MQTCILLGSLTFKSENSLGVAPDKRAGSDEPAFPSPLDPGLNCRKTTRRRYTTFTLWLEKREMSE